MNRSVQRILLLLPLLFAMLAVNWFVDPAHLRAPNAYERSVAKMLAQGKAVTNVVNDDASAILEYHILTQTSAPDVLLLGTSKSKGVNSEFFPGQTFFNAALSGSGMGDLVVIYEMYESRGLVPGEVILELNPWLLSAGRTSQVPRFETRRAELEWKLLRGGAPARPSQMKRTRFSQTIYARMVTPDYFQSSLLNLWSASIHGGAPREYHAGDPIHGLTYFPDGSILVRPDMIANLGSEIPEAYALKYAWDPPGGIPLQIDPLQRKILEAFLAHLLESGTKVTLYLPPYHPTSYELMMNAPSRFVTEIQQYFVDLAQTNGLTVIGSFDPHDLGVTNADFYDPTHISTEAVLRIFEGGR